jgi:hypothetical protein
MTIKAAAYQMGVAHGALSSWENDASYPSKPNGKRADAFIAREI